MKISTRQNRKSEFPKSIKGIVTVIKISTK